MTRIYKILPRTEWEAAQAKGQFEGSAVDLADGFIHFSAADQAAETARRYFAGQADLLVLVVEAQALGEALKWEPSRGGALFPHLFGPLPCALVIEARRALAASPQAGGDTPVFLKVAPDLDEGEAEAITEAAVAHGLDGVIVSNTTTARPDTLRSRDRGEAGGLSGAPLLAPSTRVLRTFHAAAAGRLALVGVGGIASGADAYDKVRAGAAAVQLYSALVFEGPGLVRRIRRELAERLKADGFRTLAEAVGAR